MQYFDKKFPLTPEVDLDSIGLVAGLPDETNGRDDGLETLSNNSERVIGKVFI